MNINFITGGIQSFRKIEWDKDLNIEYLKSLPLICYYTRRELTFKLNKFNTLSLERKDNSKGYNRDNVVFCCHMANVAKNDLDISEFKQMIIDLYKNIDNF